MTAELVCVDPARIQEIWPHVRGMIHRAIERGDFGSFAPVERAVLAGDALVWLAWNGEGIEAAAVTELHQSEWRKVCVIVACASRGKGARERADAAGMDRWLPLIAGIEKYARAEGCVATRIVGRPGWERVLDEYKRHRVVLEKELTSWAARRRPKRRPPTSSR
jgi:hypothetical protein